MKTASILLTLVMAMCFTREAGAIGVIHYDHDYTFTLADYEFGFHDFKSTGGNRPSSYSVIHLGPIGDCDSPFTATQGLIGFCLILAMLIALPVVVAARWKKKRAVP